MSVLRTLVAKANNHSLLPTVVVVVAVVGPSRLTLLFLLLPMMDDGLRLLPKPMILVDPHHDDDSPCIVRPNNMRGVVWDIPVPWPA